MAALSIPQQIITGFTKIATIPDESFSELLSAFHNVPLKIIQHRLFDFSGIELITLSHEDTKAISDALIPLYRGIAGNQVEAERYVDDVVDSLIEEKDDNASWVNSKTDVARFKERLTQLLGIPSLQLAARAHDVLLEHEKTFSGVRILSDIRPVFGEDAEELPGASVIIHMLNLAYYEAGKRHEFALALDTKDVQILLDACERAKKKTDTLRTLIASTNMTYIEVE